MLFHFTHSSVESLFPLHFGLFLFSSQNEYMKDNFLIKIETWHKPDLGHQENVISEYWSIFVCLLYTSCLVPTFATASVGLVIIWERNLLYEFLSSNPVVTGSHN